VIYRLAPEERHVELVCHQRHGDVMRQAQMPARWAPLSRAAALIGRLVAIVDAQGVRRVVIEEERRDVIVVDHEQHLHPTRLNPGSDGREAVEDRLPSRVELLAGVLGVANGG
jgi:hypothetical protein